TFHITTLLHSQRACWRPSARHRSSPPAITRFLKKTDTRSTCSSHVAGLRAAVHACNALKPASLARTRRSEGMSDGESRFHRNRRHGKAHGHESSAQGLSVIDGEPASCEGGAAHRGGSVNCRIAAGTGPHERRDHPHAS